MKKPYYKEKRGNLIERNKVFLMIFYKNNNIRSRVSKKLTKITIKSTKFEIKWIIRGKLNFMKQELRSSIIY